MKSIIHKKIEKSNYRLYPILINKRVKEYKLQKKYTIPLIGSIWITIVGKKDIFRSFLDDENYLIDIAKELESISEHLQTIKYIEFV